MENILMDYDAEDDKMLIELTDFGLASQLTDKEVMSAQVSTLVCMAPEMLLSQECSSKMDC